ncbi:hypothetical protein KRR39_22800 [Nocardioides panacis]|uniref:Uncharacterized protein n=1 Tax=Nocardioides panacis TaxID=2849501 RepID=A0A975SY83_9ACTN|nr:hypothetical protein [Nocardioides panacis]QWZ08132.1 hypothetical protein KRR39_22800 [Nocardioides panacis]
MTPQVWVDPISRPDLVDGASGVVLEADCFELHGRVLRFSWEHVMFEPQ